MGQVTAATLLRSNGGISPIAIQDVGVVPSHIESGQVEYHYAYGPGLLPVQAADLDAPGMWRYRALLPLDEGPIRYPLPIGGTPLWAPPRLRVTSGLAHLWLKDETRSPTASNKDRATALVLEHAMRFGATTVTCASTGNVAVSLAVGAAAVGLRAVIFVAESVSGLKLDLMLLTGATVLQVSGGYQAAFALSLQAARAFGWYDRNTGVNPLTLEAKKTVAFEMWEQLGRRIPDAILVPLGDGVTLSGIAKGFRELQACGACDRLPRLIGVQAEGCQPIKRVWEGAAPLAPTPPETVADGIAVSAPIGGTMAIRDLRACGGSVVAVSDAAILEAVGTLARSGGILAEPAAAAAYAGLTPALEAGLITPDETVVVHVTGSGLKTPAYLKPHHSAVRVHATLEDVSDALSKAPQPASSGVESALFGTP